MCLQKLNLTVLRITSWILWLGGLALFAGCASVNIPKTNPDIIAKLSQKQPAPVWVTPPLSVLKSTKSSQGLTGLSNPGGVPSYLSFMQDIEPPLVVGMYTLADGSLLYVSPLEMEMDFHKFVFANYAREVFTRVNVVHVNSENGLEQWSRELKVKGVFDVNEINSTLLFHSRAFDTNGKYVEGELIALDKESGEVKWQRKFTRPFLYLSIIEKHNQIVFATETGQAEEEIRIVEGVNLATGKNDLLLKVKGEADQKEAKNTWPILFPNGIMLFEKGIAFYRLPGFKEFWKIEDIELKGSVQPIEFNQTVYFQTKEGLEALDVRSGKRLWTNRAIKEKLTKIFRTANHLFAATAKEGWFSQTHMLSMINPSSGKTVWQRKTESILGNLAENDKTVFFSTKDQLVSLGLKNGTEVYSITLPWDDDFSSHSIMLRDQGVIVTNEWNAAMWDVGDGKLIYHHKFEPLCPIMTTRERMLEQKALGRPVTVSNVNAFTYNYPSRRAEYTAKFNRSMSNYRSTGNDVYLLDAQMNYGMTRAAMGQERVMAGIQQSAALSQATMSAAISIMGEKVLAANSMIYPAIDDVLKKQRVFDSAEYAIRLVGVQDGAQRFSALEVLDLASGKAKRTVLSPYQMPDTLKTIGSSFLKATEIEGYLPVSVFQYHHFMTAVDLERKRIFHYGPGLRAGEYVSFGKKGFIRGRLWAFPLALP